ncbi:MAG: type II toxin-antitoxin system RelE/ParE family toxin [Alphaproteobacteria bacterium]|nr:type II toxin-antitoxin system RelE/ParE family toxin [Alphaproteobacteria bacterium]
MIRSIKGTPTRQFIENGKSKFSGMDPTIAQRRFAQLDAASSPQALGRLNSVGLHKLTGDLREYWSIDINGPWRILFKFENGNAYEVHIRDTHRRRRL